MPEPIKYITFDTTKGWVGILGSSKGILRATLPQPSAQDARRLLGEPVNYAEPSPGLFASLIKRFQAYFSGGRIDFPDSLDLSGATPFQRQTWQATRLIPYGGTRSYQWVARQTGKPGASRAVGQALARNPLPIIIPCHRVVNADGRLGGFGGGLETKILLLRLEAHSVTGVRPITN
jgi:methylated-DNA-[protein]-cysteine S-methyltransferase